MLRLVAAGVVILALAGRAGAQEAPGGAQSRLRVRDLGLKIGVCQPGLLDAITDVAGVRVGQGTVVEGVTSAPAWRSQAFTSAFPRRR